MSLCNWYEVGDPFAAISRTPFFREIGYVFSRIWRGTADSQICEICNSCLFPFFNVRCKESNSLCMERFFSLGPLQFRRFCSLRDSLPMLYILLFNSTSSIHRCEFVLIFESSCEFCYRFLYDSNSDERTCQKFR